MLPLLFRGSFQVDPERVADVMASGRAGSDQGRSPAVDLWGRSRLVFAGFIGHEIFHIEPSVVALVGAGLLVLLSRSTPRQYLPSVEWETLLFFAGLFIMIGALVKTGVIGRLAEAAAHATGGDPLRASMLILFVSALLSGIIDNIPYVAAMSPIVLELTQSIENPTQANALWWSLADRRRLRRKPDRHRRQRQRRRPREWPSEQVTPSRSGSSPARAPSSPSSPSSGCPIPMASLLRDWQGETGARTSQQHSRLLH